MNIIRRIEVFGDSILKGMQLNPKNKRYQIDNHIDVDLLRNRFSLEITNEAKVGCTVTKGQALLDRYLQENPDCTAIVMDFGGNDCNFNWANISQNPDEEYEPSTPIQRFEAIYSGMIQKIKEKGIRPILATLPPLDPQRFFDWFFKDLNKENILRWLGNVNSIYRFQEFYSHTVEEIAKSTGSLLVDLRGAFLAHRRIEHLLCEDGIHPNTEGQRVITDAFVRFAELH